jgi:ferrous iron transport protein A
MRLSEVKIGDLVRVIDFDEPEGVIRRQLLALGVTPGTEIKIERKAPLGDPLQISVRGFSLCLRMNEAHSLLVEPQ